MQKISKYFDVSFDVADRANMLGRVMWPFGQYGKAREVG
jgi:hypothetical protein